MAYTNPNALNFYIFGLSNHFKFCVMIQRIQSIFLLLTAVCLGLLFVLPFGSSKSSGEGILQDGLFNIHDHTAMLILTALGCLLAVGGIFMYNNRTLQIRFTYFLIMICIFIPLVGVIVYLNATQEPAVQSVDVKEQFGLAMPILALVFSFLAKRNISKDDKLVKSMDRLR